MNNILENRDLNLSLADATYLRWYEITNALSHTHMGAIFGEFQQLLDREVRKSGSPEIPTATIIRCFKKATQNVARSHALRRFESAVDTDEAA